jgi:hypothetical protein
MVMNTPTMKRQVNMSKPKFDPNKPYELAGSTKPKFDPTKEFKVADKEVDFEEDSPSALESTIRGAIQGYTFKHADEVSGVVEALWNKAKGNSAEFGELYKKYRDESRENFKKAEEANPNAYMVGEIGGGIGSVFTPGLGLAKAGTIATTAGKAAIAGGLYGVGESEKEDLAGLAKDTAIGATTGAVLDVGLRGAGKALKAGGKAASSTGKAIIDQVAKITPGAKGALPSVNRATAKLATLVPSQSASKETIDEFLSNPDLRRKARGKDFLQEADDLVEGMNTSKLNVEEGVNRRFKDLENVSLKGQDNPIKDIEAFEGVLKNLEDNVQVVVDNKQIYGPKVSKIQQDVMHVLNTGGPEAAKRPYYKTPLNEVPYEDFSQEVKTRVLHARRYLDDFMRNKNWDGLSKYEKESISKMRETLDEPLKGAFSGSTDRLRADELYRQARNKIDDLYKPLSARGVDGQHNVTIEKLNSFLKSGGARGKAFEHKVKNFGEFLELAESEIGKIPEARAALKSLETLRELGGIERLQEHLNRSGGGPTSQAMNLVLQGLGASATGGWSLLAYPITNPAGWARIVDSLADAPGSRTFINSIEKASKAIESNRPGLGAALRSLAIDSSEED